MLNQPVSSRMIRTMFGFCWAAAGPAARPSIITMVAKSVTRLPMIPPLSSLERVAESTGPSVATSRGGRVLDQSPTSGHDHDHLLVAARDAHRVLGALRAANPRSLDGWLHHLS